MYKLSIVSLVDVTIKVKGSALVSPWNNSSVDILEFWKGRIENVVGLFLSVKLALYRRSVHKRIALIVSAQEIDVLFLLWTHLGFNVRVVVIAVHKKILEHIACMAVDTL